MLTVKYNGRIVRWAYFFSNDGIPARVTLCELFWRCVLITPLSALLVVALVCAIAFGLSCAAWIVFTALVLFPWKGILLSVLAVAVMVMMWADKRRRELGADHVVPAPVVAVGEVASAAYHGVKDKYCPMVQIARPWEA